MAIGLGTGVPWIMCKQDDAPDPVINAINGFYCDYFSPNTAYKPKMWTEAWTGWFTEFGGPVPHRPTEDMAFSVARFYKKGDHLSITTCIMGEQILGELLMVISLLQAMTMMHLSMNMSHVFKSKLGACAAFLANYNPKSYVTVAFGNMHYNLPPWSISVLLDCKYTVWKEKSQGKSSYGEEAWKLINS